MKKLLLIAPAFEYAPSEEAIARPATAFFSDKRAFMAPLAPAILAALTPDDIEIDLWDEAVHGYINDSTDIKADYDLVGITGYSSQIERMRKIARLLHKYGFPTVIGGPGVSSSPERYLDMADILFIGEAELLWPRFIRDWRAGVQRTIYRQVSKPSLAVSPVPRWLSLSSQMGKYFFGPVQTTRGCPFNCDFCDVPFIFGHRLRLKPVEQVLEETRQLHKLDVDKIFFCDDNFIGNPEYAKNLLQRLIPLNNSLPDPIGFFTQTSINVAKYDELLELLADANFVGLFIGIETPNKQSLKETNKIQNYQTDILKDIHKIQSYGLPITAGIITGFDHDTPEIFDQQFEFLQESGIPKPRIHLLCAPQGTKLWRRLRQEGRLLEGDDDPVMPRVTTNVIPKGMKRIELFRGYLDLHERINSWNNIAERINKFTSGVKRQPKVKYRKRVYNADMIQPLFLSLEEETRNAIFSIIRHAYLHAPFMLPRIMYMIFTELNQVHLLERLRRGIEKQIKIESAEGFRYEFAKIEVVLPENFKEHYYNLFLDAYQRVSQWITHEEDLEEALIEIFTLFLDRFGEGFERLENYHQEKFNELCTQAIDKAKGKFQPPPRQTRSHVVSSGVKRMPPADGILQAVEQELLCLKQKKRYEQNNPSSGVQRD